MSMPNPDPLQAAIYATVTKLADVLDRFVVADAAETNAKEELAKAEANKKTVLAEYAACYQTANLFGFNLDDEWRDHLQRNNPLLFPSDQIAPPPAASPALTAALTAEEPKTIKERILEAVERAYPKAVRAAVLRQYLEDEFRIKTHEKTVGMTLYRLLRDGYVRRKGWDWFFVPEADRRKPTATEERESPADEAGLLQEALD